MIHEKIILYLKCNLGLFVFMINIRKILWSSGIILMTVKTPKLFYYFVIEIAFYSSESKLSRRKWMDGWK